MGSTDSNILYQNMSYYEACCNWCPYPILLAGNWYRGAGHISAHSTFISSKFSKLCAWTFVYVWVLWLFGNPTRLHFTLRSLEQKLIEKWTSLKGKLVQDCIRVYLAITRKWAFFGAKLFSAKVITRCLISEFYAWICLYVCVSLFQSFLKMFLASLNNTGVLLKTTSS